MCGIVGYLGEQNPKDVILSGLKKLEYRGYDSAGIAILDNSVFKVVRAEGKLNNLETKVREISFTGHVGIGHTRWATHGVPSERNAHPHQVDGISVVHNGIIENYLEIKEELLATGSKILSETDTELLAHLLAKAVKETQDLTKAVLSILPKIRGAFSVLVVWDKHPDQIVCFKDGPPLILGLGKNETFVVSDVQAAVQHTQRFMYLEDREVAVAEKNSVKVFNFLGQPIAKKITDVKWNNEMADKAGYSHYMLKEIYEQPRVFAAATAPYIDLKNHKIKIPDLNIQAEKIDRIVIVACGTSYYAGLVGKYLIEARAQIPVEVDVASEFRYRTVPLTQNSLVISISQSGETADTLAAVRLAKQKKVRVLSICNVQNSTIDREADFKLYMNAGIEVGVASTKAMICTLGVLQCLSVDFGQKTKQLSSDDETAIVHALIAIPSQIEAVLSFDKYFSEAAKDLKKFKGFLYMGRGSLYPIALEGALKMKELAYVHAEGYAAGEMKHGPLALIDQDMAIVMMAPRDAMFEKTVSNLEEAKARGGVIISIGTGEDTRLRSISHRFLSLPSTHDSTQNLLGLIPLQLMAFHMACSMGHDVDQPRNLAKSVTVE
jgi:glutamine---fructose-6-phosphate transaminase (isomerizing)